MSGPQETQKLCLTLGEIWGSNPGSYNYICMYSEVSCGWYMYSNFCCLSTFNNAGVTVFWFMNVYLEGVTFDYPIL